MRTLPRLNRSFAYAALWCVVAGCVAAWATRRFTLPGERAFALQLALTFGGLCAVEWLLIAPGPRAAGLRIDQWAEIVTFAGAIAYLYRTRHRHGPDVIAPAVPLAPAGQTGASPAPVTPGSLGIRHPGGPAAARPGREKINAHQILGRIRPVM